MDNLKKRIKNLDWFPKYQTFPELGIKGKRDKTNKRVQTIFSHIDCEGKTVLDLGCNLGRFCVEAAKRGAQKIVGVDCQKDTIECAQIIAQEIGVDVDYRVMDISDLDQINALPESDIVFFLSVIDSLGGSKTEEHKNCVIKAIAQKTKEVLVFEGHRLTDMKTFERYRSFIWAYTDFMRVEEYRTTDQTKGRGSKKERPLLICRRL